MSNVGVVRARDKEKYLEELKRKPERPERYRAEFQPLKRLPSPVIRDGANDWRSYPSLKGKP